MTRFIENKYGQFIPLPNTTRGVEIIEQERASSLECFAIENDRLYKNDELIWAAMTYASASTTNHFVSLALWPFSETDFHPNVSIANLAKAGAFIAAEIDRRLAEGEEDPYA